MVMGCEKAKCNDSTILMADWNFCAIFAFALNESIRENFTDETSRNRFFDLNKRGFSYQMIEHLMIQEGLKNLSFNEFKLVIYNLILFIIAILS